MFRLGAVRRVSVRQAWRVMVSNGLFRRCAERFGRLVPVGYVLMCRGVIRRGRQVRVSCV